jgi:ribonuclease HII
MRSKKFLRAEQAPLVWDVVGLVAGVDEAGRGPLAGPVVAAAVILEDGNRLPKFDVLAEAIVKGDAKVQAISAASILAKVHRDRWCVQFDALYPLYGFAGHKGYGTTAHLAALRLHGACPQHRRTFSPVAEVLT